ncbi:hypothetical protein [Caloranaerobacter ferrireducens]|uniref:hypothetical protein n=1 Tax=Caloranaerobacter ferrireducens TaxID=1323370 RepID=UPI00084DAC27|nr:hypothetical protein [Caloranaerobacter ferrireducens]
MSARYAFKRECPECKSKNVEQVGTSHSTGNNYEVLKETMKSRFKCCECNNVFYINEKNLK